MVQLLVIFPSDRLRSLHRHVARGLMRPGQPHAAAVTNGAETLCSRKRILPTFIYCPTLFHKTNVLRNRELAASIRAANPASPERFLHNTSKVFDDLTKELSVL